jgi:hypothetical protein
VGESCAAHRCRAQKAAINKSAARNFIAFAIFES